MRILQVSEDIPYANMGGLAKHVLNLARALIAEGHTVDILGGDQHSIEIAGAEGEFGGRFYGELSGHIAGWKESKFRVFMPYRRTWIAKRFARIIMRHASNYDVIHYHGHIPNIGLFIPKHINFVQTRHDHGSDCLIDTRFRKGKVCTETSPLACAGCRAPNPNLAQSVVSTIAVTRYRSQVVQSFERHKTVFVSDMLKQNLARTFGEKKSWGMTVHNFVNKDNLVKVRETAGNHSTQDGNFNVFIAAKLYEAKGIEAFLREAATRLRPDMRITIAGDGPDEARLRAEFESDQIRFLGWCKPDETLHMAASSDAIVVPSIWEEPCATTILEGMILGKPIFALSLGATPELSVYASSPGQLRLYPDMPALVQGLIAFTSRITYPVPPKGIGGAEKIVQQLMHIYRSPPGNPCDSETLKDIATTFDRRVRFEQ